MGRGGCMEGTEVDRGLGLESVALERGVHAQEREMC